MTISAAGLQLSPRRLIEACADLSEEGGITIRTALEPLGGPGAPVKPAVYAGGRYQVDKRWDDAVDPPEEVEVVVVDNVPSQANRLEGALRDLLPRTGMPEMVLDLSDRDLPPHLPTALSSFQFPHRQADAYLRDSVYEGKPFPKTAIGEALFAATGDNPGAIFQWFPQAALYGFWQSHLGNKRSQAKLARSWVSEVVGYRPATKDTKVLALKGDPLNLSVDERAEFDEDDLIGNDPWRLVTGEKRVGAGKSQRLSEIGHGQVPADSAPAAISFSRVEQRSSVSFAALRRIRSEPPGGRGNANATGRALLVGIGIAAHVAAFGRPFSLRSGCELRPVQATWRWLGHVDEDIVPPSLDDAVNLVTELASEAEAAGLPVGSQWRKEPLILRPASNLQQAVLRTWGSRS